MNNPIQGIADGLTIAGLHWQLVAVILLVLFTSQFLLYALLRRIFSDKFTGEEYVSLSLAGWLLPASLFSLLWYAGARLVSMQAGFLLGVLLPALIGVALLARTPKGRLDTSRAMVAAILLLAALFILLRLAFVSQAVVPLYFDSAQHYFFIQGILAGLETTDTWAGALSGYYHLGFHILSASITFLSGAQITDTMLVLGQVMLALMPFSVFFIVSYVTHSGSAGLFAIALAAFGWYMPAHAMDWGKYPALASLALLPFVLSLAYLSIQNRQALALRNYLALNGLLATAAVLSIFLHSRTLVVYVLLALTWLVTSAWNRLSKKVQLLFLGLVILFTITEIVYVPSRGILVPLLNAYGMDAILVGSCILILSIFAYQAYPSLVFFCVVSIFLLITSLFIPLINLIPGYANTTLLDRPYVQMVLHLPLTLIGGFGLAGLEQFLQGRKIRSLSLVKVASIFFIGLVAVNALFQYDFYPADCCKIVSTDDLAAINWLKENLPRDALILTSSTDLNVLPTDEFQGSAGGDAGTWITPLTGRPVTYMPYNTDFSQRQIWETLCQMQVDYVYVGQTGWFFNDTGMRVLPDGYRPLMALPKARIYKITGCR